MIARQALTLKLASRLHTRKPAREIARLCGVSPITVAAWLNGQGANARHLVRLAELTGAHLPNEFDALREHPPRPAPVHTRTS